MHVSLENGTKARYVITFSETFAAIPHVEAKAEGPEAPRIEALVSEPNGERVVVEIRRKDPANREYVPAPFTLSAYGPPARK
jgi:hypothetical protein